MPTIKLFANLRNIAEAKEISVTGTSLKGVLNELVEEVPALDGVILEDGQIRPHFVTTINGRNEENLDVNTSFGIDLDVVSQFIGNFNWSKNSKYRYEIEFYSENELSNAA